jgi:hypothetical protein
MNKMIIWVAVAIGAVWLLLLRDLPLGLLPGIALVGFGVVVWMLIRIERAVKVSTDQFMRATVALNVMSR